MRNVPIFQRRRQVKRRRDSAWPAALALCLGGCFFELAELAEGGIGGGGAGGSGVGGAVLGGGGNTPGGSSNGGSGNSGNCGSGQTFCGNGCVPLAIENGCGDPSCLPCLTGFNMLVSCDPDRRECKVDGCDPGFADCDGDVIADRGRIEGNG